MGNETDSNKRYSLKTQSELVSLFYHPNDKITENNHFCFLLGSGASLSSGIPTGITLSRKWYERLKKDNVYEDWMNDINDTNIGEFYTKIFDLLFMKREQEAYEELTNIMGDKTPSLAYAILSQILAQGQHHTVLTTNFDFLIEDAVRMYTDSKPFVVGHESLAGYIKFHKKRPTIIKIHRDLFLEPQNTSAGTAHLNKQWEVALNPLLEECRLLVLGYGGNDDSLMDYLKNVAIEKRQAIYWCIRRGGYINKKVESILTEKDYVIEIDGFDELMYDLLEQLEIDFCKNLDIPEDHQFIKTAKKRMQNLNDKLIELAIKSKYKNLKNMLSGVSEIIFNADQEKDENCEKIYQDGIKKYPDNIHLLNEYAIFLAEQNNFDAANELYEKITKISPDYEYTYSNWGRFLGKVARIGKDLETEAIYNQAFEKYEKAVQINPEYENTYCNWGNTLVDLAKLKSGTIADNLYNQAFEKYEKAIEINPNFEIAYDNWANSLIEFAKTNNSADADVLYYQAFEKFEKATKTSINFDIAYNNWGNALYDLAKKKEGEEMDALYNQAFEKYKKAIQLNPYFEEAYCNWGCALDEFAETKECKEAETLYKQAFEKYEKSIQLNPDYEIAYNNWGNALVALAEIKENKEAEDLFNQAFEKYEKTIKINPDYEIAYSNWGNALYKFASTKDEKIADDIYKQAFEKYDKSIQLNPNGEFPYYSLALWLVQTGNKKIAFNYLEHCLRSKYVDSKIIEGDNDWNTFHDDEDFIDLLKRYTS